MKEQKLKHIKHSGFTAPEDYFETLEDTLLAQVKLEEMRLNSNSGFSVPQGYFDTLDSTIIKHVNSKKQSKVISIFNRSHLIYFGGIAASIVLLFNLVLHNRNSWNSIKSETVEDYLVEEDLTSYEIASNLTDNLFPENAFLNEDYSDQSIENYVNENLDIDDIFTE